MIYCVAVGLAAILPGRFPKKVTVLRFANLELKRQNLRSEHSKNFSITFWKKLFARDMQARHCFSVYGYWQGYPVSP